VREDGHEMKKAVKGDWVQISKIILKAGERAPNIPTETKKVPLIMKIKGFLAKEYAYLGETVEIKTVTGRELTGEMIAVNPIDEINFGKPQPELITIGKEVKALLAKE